MKREYVQAAAGCVLAAGILVPTAKIAVDDYHDLSAANAAAGNFVSSQNLPRECAEIIVLYSMTADVDGWRSKQQCASVSQADADHLYVLAHTADERSYFVKPVTIATLVGLSVFGLSMRRLRRKPANVITPSSPVPRHSSR